MENGHPIVKLIVGGTLVKSAFDDMKGAFLSEDFAYCMAFLNKSHDEEYDVGLLGQ